MTTLSETAVLEALKVVRDPDLGRDIVSLGFIKDLDIRDGHVAFAIELTTPACPVKDQMRDEAHAIVSGLDGVTSVDVQMTASVRSAMVPGTDRSPIPGVKNIISRVVADESAITSEALVDRCLDQMGPLELSELTRKES